MREHLGRYLALLIALAACCAAAAPTPQPVTSGEELAVAEGTVGNYGGRLVTALRSEPKTLNPVTALDGPSRDVIGRMVADLLHINRATQQVEPALAKSWKVSPDGLHYTLRLRRGIRFSDGHPFDADDVLFSFGVYLDEKVGSPVRDLLVVGGQPIKLRKLDAYTVAFDLAKPYAAAERLFDSIAILPRHKLESAYQQGKLAQTWNLNAAASDVVGLGPFRRKEYAAGQQLVLERNPYYWKQDRVHHRLPYVDEIVFLFVPSEDAQVIRFESGETDLLSRISADNYETLSKDQQARGFHVYDLGPGLEYNFLFFNQNSALPKDSAALQRKQSWFKDDRFRQAMSYAVDRKSIVRLVYRNRATPLWTHVTPANKLWVDTAISLPPRSVEHARDLLKSAGFSWKPDGTLTDGGQPVEFTILTSASNAQRTQIATLIQSDLAELGIKAQVVPMEFRAMLSRVFDTHDYEAAVLALGGGDVDPNPQMNVWLSSGTNHLWDIGEAKPATPWEAEIDQLMTKQLTTLKVSERKRLYDRVQEIVAQEQPLVCLVSPNILVAARDRVGNFQPAILDHYTLWNADQLFLRDAH